MWQRAFDEQKYEPASVRCTTEERRKRKLTFFALALGTFCFGTTEFATMGVVPLVARDLRLSVSDATSVVSAYATGVIVGGPLIVLGATGLNRRTLLLLLMTLFVAGNVLASATTNLAMLSVARFLIGLPQAAYVGAGVVVAVYIVGRKRAGRAFSVVMMGLTVAAIVGSPLSTLLGQTVGWRNAYLAIAALGLASLAALWTWLPDSGALDGRGPSRDLPALAKPRVWAVMTVAALGVGGIFSVYTFIGPFVTEAARLQAPFIPIAIGLVGVGMSIGNAVGGWLADTYRSRGVVIGFGTALVVLWFLASNLANPWALMLCLMGVGTTVMSAVPTIQVQLTRLAPEAPTLMGAMNFASLTVASAIGAWAARLATSGGRDLSLAVSAGFDLTLIGLALFLFVLATRPLFQTRPAARGLEAERDPDAFETR